MKNLLIYVIVLFFVANGYAQKQQVKMPYKEYHLSLWLPKESTDVPLILVFENDSLFQKVDFVKGCNETDYVTEYCRKSKLIRIDINSNCEQIDFYDNDKNLIANCTLMNKGYEMSWWSTDSVPKIIFKENVKVKIALEVNYNKNQIVFEHKNLVFTRHIFTDNSDNINMRVINYYDQDRDGVIDIKSTTDAQ